MKTLLHLLRFVAKLDSPESQVSERELEVMLRYVRNARTICEIGCYEGKTSVAFALNSAGTVYSIDPFFSGRLGICYPEYVARLHRRRSGVHNLVFLKGLSHQVAPRFISPIDFLFIDADHSYEAIKRDWEDWSNKVALGGFIALHDCKSVADSPNLLGSARFYSEDIPLFDNVVEKDSVDSLVVFQVQRVDHAVVACS
jgi:predicted O-methyltransferase YrrM